MNTWAAHATAHAPLTSGFGAGAMPAFGPASLYGFALGASATVLALVVLRSPRQLNLPWRLADLWGRAVRLAQVRKRGLGQAPPPISSRSRFRQRVDLVLLQMLGDDVDEHSESCPAAADPPGTDPPRTDPPGTGTDQTRRYRSKHRLPGPAKESPGRKRTPRHAA